MKFLCITIIMKFYIMIYVSYITIIVASLIHIQLYIHTGSQLIIDTHVEEICTLCSEECTSSSLLVLRLEMYIYIYIYIRAVR